jgi:polar amino acid transport system substrate-binding protein
VYDRPLLSWLVRERYSDSLQVLDATFDPQDYAIALPQGSKLRLPIDLALLDTVHNEWWRETVFSYVGRN